MMYRIAIPASFVVLAAFSWPAGAQVAADLQPLAVPVELPLKCSALPDTSSPDFMVYDFILGDELTSDREIQIRFGPDGERMVLAEFSTHIFGTDSLVQHVYAVKFGADSASSFYIRRSESLLAEAPPRTSVNADGGTPTIPTRGLTPRERALANDLATWLWKVRCSARLE